MPKMIQIRNVPDDIHQKMKDRAVREGMTLSDYIKNELRKSAEQLTMREWLENVQKLPKVRGKVDSVKIIRKLREGK